MSDKYNKCNGIWDNPRNEYFVAVFKLKGGRIDGIVEKCFCQTCWEQEESNYRKEAGRMGDITKTKMVQKEAKKNEDKFLELFFTIGIPNNELITQVKI